MGPNTKVLGESNMDIEVAHAIAPAAIPGKRRALLRAAPLGTTVLAMSGVSGAGVQPVLGALFAAIEAARADAAEALVPGALAFDVVRRSVEKGLLLFAPVGFGGGTGKICPPLVISEAEIDRMVDGIGNAIEDVAAAAGASA